METKEKTIPEAIEEAKNLRWALQENILDLLRTFEKETGLQVGGVSLHRMSQISDVGGDLSHINVQISL